MREETHHASMTQVMVKVIAGRKIRDHGKDTDPASKDEDFSGMLVGLPTVGRNLMIYRSLQRDVITTSEVRNISMDPDGALRVETLNSTYRLVLNTTKPSAHEAAADPR